MPCYSINKSRTGPRTSEVNEGDILFTSINTTVINPSTFLYWTFYRDEINNSYFSYEILSKALGWSLISNTESIPISLTKAVNQSSERDKFIYQRWYLDSTRTIKVKETVQGTIKDTSNTQIDTYSISTSSASTMNEVENLTTTVETKNVAQGTILYRETHNNDLSTYDFISSSPGNGSGTVGSDGLFTFSQRLKNDSLTAAYELFDLKLFMDS